MSIELRLSDVDPPLADPPRTIYRDVLNLPDPVKLGITVRYFNYDEVGLYFQITGQASGYTFGTVNLGLLGSGQNAYRNLDEFGSRSRPSAGQFSEGEFDEDITLILKAYTDAGYSNLKWTHERTVGVHWIKSNDPAFTVDVLNDFDDGTVQGWAIVNVLNFNVSIGVATDFVLSAPYSLKGSGQVSVTGQNMLYIWKSFTTPNKNKVFAIIDLRVDSTYVDNKVKLLTIQRDLTILVYIGRPHDTVMEDYVPLDKWMRVIVPLPKNTGLQARVYLDVYSTRTLDYAYVWMDDFKIISKD